MISTAALNVSGPAGLVHDRPAGAIAGRAHAGAAVAVAMVALRRDRDVAGPGRVAMVVMAVVVAVVVAMVVVVRSRGDNLLAVVVFGPGGLDAETHFGESRGGDKRCTRLLGARRPVQLDLYGWLYAVSTTDNGEMDDGHQT